MNSFFNDKKITLYRGDCIQILRDMNKKSVDLIFADPPYFLSDGGITCQSGQMVSVNKGNWDKSRGKLYNLLFTRDWLRACERVLKPSGNIWISGTLHNIYDVGYCLNHETGFKIVNDITWYKSNAPPHLAQKQIAHAHETLLWATPKEDKDFYFNYGLAKKWTFELDFIKRPGKQMRSVWIIPKTPTREKYFICKTCKKYLHAKFFNKHENHHTIFHKTQKPLEILNRIIQLCSKPGDVILDPFCGTGTTGVISCDTNRQFIGIDKFLPYLKITRHRLKITYQKKKRQIDQFIL